MARDQVDLEAAEDTATADPGPGGAAFQVLGTWSGTITFEAKTKGAATWVSILVTNVATNAQVTTTTANGVFRVVADGLDLRARMSSYTSGTANVDIVETRF